MTIAKFNMKDIAKLATELEEAGKYAPTMEDLWNPKLYPNNMVVDEKGLPVNHPSFGWPDATKIMKDKLEPQLTIVKDNGCYLITNADLEGSAESRGTIAFAQGCNPNTDDDFYENAVDILGDDDDSVSIPINWYNIAKEKNKRLFQIEFKSNTVRLKL
ncbi:DUF3085 domain-containing protein [Vibrio parahaemolyticus]|nr:DUF3085 domain-containing protein [Vibrio parahaemolyticus]